VSGDNFLIFDSRASERFLNAPTGVEAWPAVVSMANERVGFSGILILPNGGSATSFPAGLETIRDEGALLRARRLTCAERARIHPEGDAHSSTKTKLHGDRPRPT